MNKSKSFKFMTEWLDCIDGFCEEHQAEIVFAMVRYCAFGEEPKNPPAHVKAAFTFARPFMDKNIQWENNKEERRRQRKEVNRKRKRDPLDDGLVHGEKYVRFIQWMQTHASNFYDACEHILTEDEMNVLVNTYGREKFFEVIVQIENRKDKRYKYSNMYVTLLNWLKGRFINTNGTDGTN